MEEILDMGPNNGVHARDVCDKAGKYSDLKIRDYVSGEKHQFLVKFEECNPEALQSFLQSVFEVGMVYSKPRGETSTEIGVLTCGWGRPATFTSPQVMIRISNIPCILYVLIAKAAYFVAVIFLPICWRYFCFLYFFTVICQYKQIIRNG